MDYWIILFELHQHIHFARSRKHDLSVLMLFRATDFKIVGFFLSRDRMFEHVLLIR